MSLTLQSFFITCVLCYGVFRYIMWHLRRRRLYELASKMRGPPVLPIIGNAHLFIADPEDLLNGLIVVIKSYGSPCRAWFGPRLAVGVTDPEQIKAICLSSKALGKSDVIEDYGRPLLGTGLLIAPVSTWQVHRKLIQPTFNTKILESFVEVFADQSNILTERLEQKLDGPEFEIFESLSLCTLDMICETAMGVKVGAQTNGNSRYVKAIREILPSYLERFFHFWLQPGFIFFRTKLGKDQRNNIKYLHDFIDDVIQIRKSEFLNRNTHNQPGEAENEYDASYTTTRREAFLDHLMELRYENGQFSDEQLRDEVNMMVMAGNDTTAITSSYVMLMLASNPDVQEKVYQEIYEIYGNSDGKENPVTSKDLPRMKYLERVIKETMRLFPVGPFILRFVTEDLNIGEHTLPSGTTIAIGILNLHRDEKYWPDPLKFDPDRFLPEENAKRHPYSYMPFSIGPRNCIGLNYAMMSMKTLIATVLRRYILKKDNIVPVKDIRLKLDILISTVDPIAIRIERRSED